MKINVIRSSQYFLDLPVLSTEMDIFENKYRKIDKVK